ncbi:MAG: cyclic nucleotide-binding domain-containing protein [Alphaproteobacteria bacterium]|nr:cyclic nucleotide-binding domain-containing protein [Alphaproteobacteria bacterium]
MDDPVDALREVQLFRLVPIEHVRRLIAAGTQVSFKPGEVVFERGELGEHALLVIEGRLSATVEGKQKLRRVGDIWPGEIVGELALLQPDVPRSATVRAAAPCQCLVVTRELLQGTEGNLAAVALEQHMLTTMARRIRSTNHAIRMLWQEQRAEEGRMAKAQERAAGQASGDSDEKPTTLRDRIAAFFGGGRS